MDGLRCDRFLLNVNSTVYPQLFYQRWLFLASLNCRVQASIMKTCLGTKRLGFANQLQSISATCGLANWAKFKSLLHNLLRKHKKEPCLANFCRSGLTDKASVGRKCVNNFYSFVIRCPVRITQFLSSN